MPSIAVKSSTSQSGPMSRRQTTSPVVASQPSNRGFAVPKRNGRSSGRPEVGHQHDAVNLGDDAAASESNPPVSALRLPSGLRGRLRPQHFTGTRADAHEVSLTVLDERCWFSRRSCGGTGVRELHVVTGSIASRPSSRRERRVGRRSTGPPDRDRDTVAVPRTRRHWSPILPQRRPALLPEDRPPLLFARLGVDPDDDAGLVRRALPLRSRAVPQ